MAFDEVQMYALLKTEMWGNSAALTLPASSLYRAG
jgi:antitoxin component of MazEF toxin-antitoxin module